MSEGSQANIMTSVLSFTCAAPTARASVRDMVRSVVCETLELRGSDARPGDEESLVAAGLSSMGLVALILALESRFDVEVPRREMAAENFHSIVSIAALMSRLAGPGSLQVSPAEFDRHAAG